MADLDILLRGGQGSVKCDAVARIERQKINLSSFRKLCRLVHHKPSFVNTALESHGERIPRAHSDATVTSGDDTVRRRSVLFEKRRIGTAPALTARPSSARLPLPTVLWFHGFTAGKATHRPELATLAEAGFLAVGIDAAGHGERRLPDFEVRFSGTQDENDREFYALVAETAAEVPGIVDLLCGAGLADEARIGAAGVSMGGMIAYGATTADPRIRAAVALLASPEWPQPASPHLEIDRFFPTALLSVTAGRDETVPPAAARAFHAELEERYRQHPERLRYVELPDSLHMMTPEDWAWSIRESAGWLSRFTR